MQKTYRWMVLVVLSVMVSGCVSENASIESEIQISVTESVVRESRENGGGKAGDLRENNDTETLTSELPVCEAVAEEKITLEEAKQMAMDYADVKAEDLLYFDVKLDDNDGVLQYEVEFFASGSKYKYNILASDGSVRSYSYDSVSAYKRKNQLNPSKSGQSEGLILEDEAKKIAIDHAGITLEDMIPVRVNLDMDDVIYRYEIKFYEQGKIYEYGIAAETGEIISVNWNVE